MAGNVERQEGIEDQAKPSWYRQPRRLLEILTAVIAVTGVPLAILAIIIGYDGHETISEIKFTLELGIGSICIVSLLMSLVVISIVWNLEARESTIIKYHKNSEILNQTIKNLENENQISTDAITKYDSLYKQLAISRCDLDVELFDRKRSNSGLDGYVKPLVSYLSEVCNVAKQVISDYRADSKIQCDVTIWSAPVEGNDQSGNMLAFSEGTNSMRPDRRVKPEALCEWMFRQCEKADRETIITDVAGKLADRQNQVHDVWRNLNNRQAGHFQSGIAVAIYDSNRTVREDEGDDFRYGTKIAENGDQIYGFLFIETDSIIENPEKHLDTLRELASNACSAFQIVGLLANLKTDTLA